MITNKCIYVLASEIVALQCKASTTRGFRIFQEISVRKCRLFASRPKPCLNLGTHYVYWAPLKYTVTVQFMFR